MKELIMGQIPDNFNSDFHIPLSPSCFIGKEECFPSFENLNYINIIESKEELTYFDQLTTQEALYWVNIIAKKYNPNDFYKHSFRFWKTIYFPWLGLLIPWIYRKVLLANKLIEKYKDEEIEVKLIDKDLDLNTDNEINFIIDGFWNKAVNEWMFSRAIEQRLPSGWEVDRKSIEVKSDIETISRFNKEKNTKQLLHDRFYKIIYRSSKIHGFSKWNELIFHLLFSLKRVSKEKANIPDFPQHSQIDWGFDINYIIESLIPRSLIKINLHEQRKYSKGKLIIYSNNLYYDINWKVDAALAYENKEDVITSQHGGHNYGSAYTFEFGKEIEFKSNYFISWGWKAQNFHIIDLPSPFLSKQVNTHNTLNKNIIIVGTDMTMFQTRFESWPTGASFLDYRKNKIHFLNSLNRAVFNKLLYRPYPEKKTSFLDSKYIIARFKNIQIHKGSLHKDMQKCNLLILDHPGTTWNLAMAMNTPVILFWNREHFPFNKNADVFLDKLKKAGIYFENPEKSAKQVNSLLEKYNDLSQWWNQKEIQSLRKEWMHEYARADKNWFWIWAKTLWKLK